MGGGGVSLHFTPGDPPSARYGRPSTARRCPLRVGDLGSSATTLPVRHSPGREV
jgi:hypothetical protein